MDFKNSNKMAEHIQVLLHTKDPSNRMYILALALTTHTFFKIKVSSPEEIIERSIKRNYKSPLKNAYMIFMTDCSEAFKDAKSEKKFRQNSECFKDFPSLWKISPQEVKDVYEQVLASYRKLKPISQNFFEFHPQNNANESQENTADQATRINC
ncbi:23242_t:CDS:1 [Rhizophagus irregularis]|nr:23242_t:CDS:1 [Rhizophagus irregularis]